MKSYFQLLFLTSISLIFSFSFTACGQNQTAAHIAQKLKALELASIPPDYQSGKAVHVAKVTSLKETPIGTRASKDDLYKRYPELKKYASELYLIDRVIETDVQTLELYNLGTLILVLQQNGESFDVLHSRNDFKAEHAMLVGGTEDRVQLPSALSFDLKSCAKDQIPNCQLINITLNLSQNLPDESKGSDKK